MASKSKQEIKAFFQTGDKPTESQFIDLIDSYVDSSGPMGGIEAAASAGGVGFAYVSASRGEVLTAANARNALGMTVYTTALAINAVAGTYTTTAQAAAAGGGSYRGAVAYNSGNQTIATGTPTAISFDSEERDTDGIHSTSVNTSRMTVPSGVTLARFNAQVGFVQSNGADKSVQIFLYKNGTQLSSTFSVRDQEGDTDSGVDTVLAFNSPPLTVTAGDYFEVFLTQNSTGNGTVYGLLTFFEMQILG